MNAAPVPNGTEPVDDAASASWYRALHDKWVDVGTEPWVLRVVGIHRDGLELWIQVVNDDAPHEQVVLHVSMWTTVHQALAAMEHWRNRADVHPRLISVVPRD
jgi:hypothetical protein